MRFTESDVVVALLWYIEDVTINDAILFVDIVEFKLVIIDHLSILFFVSYKL